MKCVLVFGLALLVVCAVLFSAGCGSGVAPTAPDRLSGPAARTGLPLSPAAAVGPAAVVPWRLFSPPTTGFFALTPDGTRAVCVMARLLTVVDLSTGTCLKTLTGHTDWVYGVAVTPDGTRAVSGAADKILKVWNLSTGACLKTIPCPARPYAVAVWAGGTRVVVGGDLGFVGVTGL